MKKTIFIIILSTLILSGFAQDSIYYRVGLSGTVSTGEVAPFWLHSNRYGMYSMSSAGSTNFGEIGKNFRKDGRWFDYGFKANGQIRFDDSGTNVYMHEYYVKFRGFGFLDLTIGAREEYLGCQDSILSSGGFLFSTNARPMPKITAGIEEYTAIPFTKGYIQVKGALVHGWMNDRRYVENTFLHHKYIYVKVGGNFPVNLHYGLNHVAQWGGNHPNLGKLANGFEDYMRIFFGKGGIDENNPNDYNNAQGNHIISKSLQLDLKTANYKLSAYWQNLYEDPPIRYMHNTINLADGLWGVSLKNDKTPFVSGILYEYLNTTDQSGPYHDKDGIIYGGNDSYFSNSIYKSGWSYFSRTIGTPFITPSAKNDAGNYFSYNNRSKVHHIGIYGNVFDYKYRFFTTISKSYGTYSSPQEPMQCTSLLLEVNKTFPKWFNIEMACAIAADFGDIPAVDKNIVKNGGNSLGLCLSVRKKGILFKFGR